MKRSSDERTQGIEDIVHWVNGELLIRPEYKAQQDAESRRKHPEMTEVQIQTSWRILECTLGVGWSSELLHAGEAMIAALQAGDGLAALRHFRIANRLDPVAAEGFVRDTRLKLSPGAACARWNFAMRRAQMMIAAIEAGDEQAAHEHLLAGSRVEPGVIEFHLQGARGTLSKDTACGQKIDVLRFENVAAEPVLSARRS